MGIEIGEFDLDSFIAESADKANSIVDSGEEVSRQIIFLLDASNSMQGYKIGAVNDCVNNILSKLKKLDRTQAKPINIFAIGFSSRMFKWTDSFVRASEFQYSYIESVDGLTDINAVFKELIPITNEMERGAKKYVVLFSDGLITEDCSESLARWQQTEQYSDITKIAVAFDDDLRDPQSSSFFEDFVGSGLVISISSQEQLLKTLMD